MGSSQSFEVLPIRYQSSNVNFPEWVSVFTLSLAPLIAHIIAGAPQPSYLCSDRPGWHDRICHFNPTSILWRYAAIADRRIRASKWDKVDMAATNAVFWTSKGWDGSEAMVEGSLPFCTLLPEHARIGIVSREMLKTLIVTFQGIQAVIALVAGLRYDLTKTSVDLAFTIYLGVDIIFFPLASLGLMRLCCAYWLTDDFVYAAPHANNMGSVWDKPGTTSKLNPTPSLDYYTPQRLAHNLFPLSTHFRPTSYWPSRAFRVAFYLPLLGFWILNIMFVMPPAYTSATAFLTSLFYLVLSTPAILLGGYYSFQGHTTTVIPCIARIWYKTYTVILMALALALLIVASIETWRSACGKYTSAPLGVNYAACLSSENNVALTAPQENQWFDIVSSAWIGTENKTKLDSGQFWIYNFTGVCLGSIHENMTRAVTLIDTQNLT